MDFELERLDATPADQSAAADQSALDALRRAASAADGIDAFVQDEDLADVAASQPGDRHAIRLAIQLDGEMRGFAAAAPTSADAETWRSGVVVHPDDRGSGFGELLANAVADAVESEGGKRLQCWAPVVSEAVDGLSFRCTFKLVRRLLKLAITLPMADAVQVPASYTITPVRDGDAEEIVAVNNAAFSWHPEQGELSVEALEADRESDWYDGDGFLVARDGDDEIAGFCWTKLHSGAQSEGEIYVICTAPAHEGRGLGTVLSLAGLEYLGTKTDKGVLYVDEGNLVARRIYSAIGFSLERVPSLFRLDLVERQRR